MRKTQRVVKCEIVANPAKRAAADSKTAEIRDHFPPGLAQPALRALAGAGYAKLEQLAGVSEADLASLHGMGPKAFIRLYRPPGDSEYGLLIWLLEALAHRRAA